VATAPLATRWVRAIAISTAVAAAVYLGTIMWAGRTEVTAALSLIGVDTLIGLLALSLLNYGLRFVRWHYYVRSLGGVISLRHDLRIYIGGFALTTTPGKAGEMARSLWLRPYGVPTTMSIAAFFAERIQDFLGIVLLASLGIASFRGGVWVLLGGVALVLSAMIILYVPTITRTLLRVLTARHGRMQQVARRITEILALTRDCFAPARFVIGLVVGICAWSAEGLGLYVLMLALGHPLPLVPAIGIFAYARRCAELHAGRPGRHRGHHGCVDEIVRDSIANRGLSDFGHPSGHALVCGSTRPHRLVDTRESPSSAIDGLRVNCSLRHIGAA
jgi:uncharacterized protein (TIRG00374 family)